MGIHVPRNSFDHRNPRYMSRTLLCRETHCFHETKKIGIVLSVWLILSCFLPVGYSIYDQTFYPEFLLPFLPVAAIITLFLGLKVKSRGLLLPCLLFLGGQIVLYMFVEMALIAGLCSSITTVMNLLQDLTTDPNAKKYISGFENRTMEIKILMAVGTFVVFLLFASTVWSFLVVQKCGLYLRDLERYIKNRRAMRENAL